MTTIFGAIDVEMPAFESLKQTEAYELRKYPETIQAMTPRPASMDAASSPFRTIAAYIFGKAQDGEKRPVAMTAPVMSNMGAEPTMSFVMPKEYTLESLPKPSDPAVQIKTVESHILAVSQFSGSVTDAVIEDQKVCFLHATSHLIFLSEICSSHPPFLLFLVVVLCYVHQSFLSSTFLILLHQEFKKSNIRRNCAKRWRKMVYRSVMKSLW